MKNVILSFLLVGFVVTASAQSLIKFKPIGLDYHFTTPWEMGFGLEHGLNNTLSIGTTINYALGTAMLSFVPEVRAYLTGSEAVSGFYVGGYGGLALYTGGGADAAGMAGASLGFQKAIGDRITMDVGTGVGGQFIGGSSNINIRPGVTFGYMLY